MRFELPKKNILKYDLLHFYHIQLHKSHIKSEII